MCAPLATNRYGLDSWHAVFATNLFGIVNVQSVFVLVRFPFFSSRSLSSAVFLFSVLSNLGVMVVDYPTFIRFGLWGQFFSSS
jgi:hypothetical protein